MPWQKIVRLKTFYNKAKIACVVKSKKGNEYTAWIGPWTENIPEKIVGHIKDHLTDVEAFVEFGGRHANIVRLSVDGKVYREESLDVRTSKVLELLKDLSREEQARVLENALEEVGK